MRFGRTWFKRTTSCSIWSAKVSTSVTPDRRGCGRSTRGRGPGWPAPEANQRLGAEKPVLEREIGKVEAQAAKTQASMDRYFNAFEAGTLQAELCNEKVRDLRTRLEELEAEKRELEARRERLELPAADREMLQASSRSSSASWPTARTPKRSTFSTGW